MNLFRQRRIARRHPKRTIELEGIPPFEMAVHQRFDRYLSYGIHELGTWEPFETELVLRLLEPGDTFVDIGANIGWYTLVAGLRVGAEGRVFSFEPDAENFAILRHNVRRNLRRSMARVATLERKAASDRDGRGRIYLSDDNMGDHRIHSDGASRSSRSIREVRLDGYFKSMRRRLSLVKVDTQGAEPNVYAGFRERLLRDRPVLLSEFWPFGMAPSGRSVGEVLNFFDALDGRCFIIDGEGESLVPISTEDLRRRSKEDLRPESEDFVDLVVMPSGHPKFAAVEDLVGEPWSPSPA